MEILKEISKLSTYTPKKGLKKRLYDLTVVKDYDREKAESIFENEYKGGQFSVVYRKLKYSLLDGVLNTSLSKIPVGYLDKVRMWKRHIQIRLLIITGNKKAGINLAIQSVTKAEKLNEWAIMQSLSRELMIQFSTRDFNNTKYQKYKDKFDLATRFLYYENKAEGYYYDLVFLIRTNRNLDHIKRQILELDQIAETNNNYKFKHLYFTFKSLYYRSVKDELNFINNNLNANDFFRDYLQDIPYQVKFNWNIELVPTYILNSNFHKAASALSESIGLAPIGSVNWHKALIYRAYLGFYSRKPKIAYSAFKKAQTESFKFNSKEVFQRWHIIKGYLAFYASIELIDGLSNFKIGRFLNVDETRNNHQQKANLIIIELLHLLHDGKRLQYLEKLERIEPYISTRFKAHEFKRTRYFLRMLKAVVKGNYHPILTKAHAIKQFNKLKAVKAELDINVLDREYIPYEILWDEVIYYLSKKKR